MGSATGFLKMETGWKPVLRYPRRQQQIRPDSFPLNLAKLKSLPQVPGALTRHGLERITPAQNFGCVEKSDGLGQSTQQEGGVRLASTFHQQAGDVFGGEFFQQPTEIE